MSSEGSSVLRAEGLERYSQLAATPGIQSDVEVRVGKHYYACRDYDEYGYDRNENSVVHQWSVSLSVQSTHTVT